MNSPIVKFFTDEEMAELRRRCDVEPGDLVMFAAGPRLEANGILGGMRSHMADALNVPREGHEFLWVVNFPLFHWDEEGQRYEAEHQPFTLPHVDELHLLDEDPLKMGSCTYDFVMDGFEAGGGGMRIHDAELQLKMLEFMGFSEERARAQFGFLMEALEFGAPPWAASRSVSTACACCWPAPTPSAMSWRSPRRAAAATSCPPHRPR